MNLFQVPYPKASLRKYALVLGAIAFSVVFILVVFEPFGTRGFVHNYKQLILAGYGAVILVGGVLYYMVTDTLIYERTKDRWSIIHEVVFLFFSVLTCLLACYLYWTFVFDRSVSMSQLMYFLMYSASVAVIPVAVYLLYIYQQYKEVAYTTTVENSSTVQDQKIALYGTNNNEQIQLATDTLLYVQSSDNYVILHLLEQGILCRKMLRNTLSRIALQLGDDFIKVHRQYLVNRSHIVDIQGNVTNSLLSLEGVEKKIPVSRTMVPKLRELV